MNDEKAQELLNKMKKAAEDKKAEEEKPGCFLLISTIFFGWAVIPLYLWVASILWDWYVIPMFPSAPHLGIKILLGLALIYGLVFQNHDYSAFEKSSESKYTTSYYINVNVWKIFHPIFALFVGWLFK